MMSLLITVSILYAVMSVVTMALAGLGRLKAFLVTKTCSGLLFIAVGYSAFIFSGSNVFFGLLPVLIFCLIGDIMLALALGPDGKTRNPHFSLGVAAFLAAHALLCWQILRYIDFHICPTVLIAALTVIMTIIFTRSDKFDFEGNEILCIIYSFFVGLSCGLGLNMIWVLGSAKGAVIMAVGTILFLISDSLLSGKYFMKKAPRGLGAIVLITYYLAMYLFAIYPCFA